MSDTTQVARGDRRRTALLEALDHHLRQADPAQASLDSINIADISRRAGVTRSAFYFYFDNKASAVAALMEEMYDESMVAADLLRGDGTPAERVEAHGAGAVRRLGAARAHLPRDVRRPRDQRDRARALGQRPRVVRARSSPGSSRPSGPRAPRPAGADATHLASVLLELNDRMLERLALGGPLGRDELVDAVVTVWVHTIYGRLG